MIALCPFWKSSSYFIAVRDRCGVVVVGTWLISEDQPKSYQSRAWPRPKCIPKFVVETMLFERRLGVEIHSILNTVRGELFGNCSPRVQYYYCWKPPGVTLYLICLLIRPVAHHTKDKTPKFVSCKKHILLYNF